MSEDRSVSLAELGAHRPYLLRFASSRLRDPDLAQEAVQDALLAALESAAGFSCKSSLRTWLTAILKHKIVDLTRRIAREPACSRLGLAEEGLGEEDGTDAEIHTVRADAWGNPAHDYERTRFWETFSRGLDELPPQAARALVLRDVHGCETDEICRTLGVTAGNCWVILHRGRNAMRGYLERHWEGMG